MVLSTIIVVNQRIQKQQDTLFHVFSTVFSLLFRCSSDQFTDDLIPWFHLGGESGLSLLHHSIDARKAGVWYLRFSVANLYGKFAAGFQRGPPFSGWTIFVHKVGMGCMPGFSSELWTRCIDVAYTYPLQDWTLPIWSSINTSAYVGKLYMTTKSHSQP